MFLFRSSKKKKKSKLVDPTQSSRLQGAQISQPPSMDMPFGWFYWNCGNLCGPCDDASILELLTKGELKEHSAVSLMNIPIATIFEDLLQRMNSASRIKAHFKNSAVGTQSHAVVGTVVGTETASQNLTSSTGVVSMQLAIPQKPLSPQEPLKEEETDRLSQQSRSPHDSPKATNAQDTPTNKRDSEGNFSSATSMDAEETQLLESLVEGRQKKGKDSKSKSKKDRRRNSADDSHSESESDDARDARRKPDKPSKKNRHHSDSESDDARYARRKPDKPAKKNRHHSDSESDDARRKTDKPRKGSARPRAVSPRPKEAEEKSRREKHERGHERGRRDKDTESFSLTPTLSVPKGRSEKGDKKEKKDRKDDSDKKSKKDKER